MSSCQWRVSCVTVPPAASTASQTAEADTAAEDELRTFLPRITVRLNEGLARGALGPQAAGGYLAFCLLGTGFGTATTWDSEQGQRRAAASTGSGRRSCTR